MTAWEDYQHEERLTRQRSRQEYIRGLKAEHGTIAGVARAMGVTKARLWKIISDSNLAVEMAAAGQRNYAWKRKMNKPQTDLYRELMRQRCTIPEALMQVGRVDLLEHADPAIWAKLQAKMRKAA